MENAKQICRTLYKNPQGTPFELTNFQAVLFDAIYRKLHPRICTILYTQFGKSDVTSMAVLTRITTFPEKWVIIGGSEDKAKIIMNKLIGHIFDNEYTKSKLLMNLEARERLRHERSRNRITFKVDDGIGEVAILSADTTKTGQDAGDILVGHGSQNLIVDDAPLMSDTINSKMVRMLGGFGENFLMKIGNALGRNHFYRSSQSDRYVEIIADYKDGIIEGRNTEEYFKEMAEEMNDPILFDSFYGCIFPPEDAPLSGVWVPLFTEEDIKRAMEGEVVHAGEKKLGVDVADSGVDHDVIVQRSATFAEIVYDNQKSDQMTLTGMTINTARDREIDRSYIDRSGVGAGVCSRMRELGFPHRPVNFGEKSVNPLYANKKAEMYWNLKKWIQNGGKLSKDRRWMELTDIRYSVIESSGKVQIMPKRISLGLGIKSPDYADALCMTFYDRDQHKKTPEEKFDREFERRMKLKQKKIRSESDYALKMCG